MFEMTANGHGWGDKRSSRQG